MTINFISHWFDLTGNQTPDLPHGGPCSTDLATTAGPPTKGEPKQIIKLAYSNALESYIYLIDKHRRFDHYN